MEAVSAIAYHNSRAWRDDSLASMAQPAEEAQRSVMRPVAFDWGMWMADNIAI